MLGADDIDMGEYEEWAIPLFELELFTHFEPMDVELMMSIPDKSVVGQLDLLGYDTKAKKIRLIDLKTKHSAIHLTKSLLTFFVNGNTII